MYIIYNKILLVKQEKILFVIYEFFRYLTAVENKLIRKKSADCSDRD